MHKMSEATCAAAILLLATGAQAGGLHGLAMHGEPKYGADFEHFDYANSQAPKGGQVKLAANNQFQ